MRFLIQIFFEENLLSLNHLKNYEYTEHLNIILDCIDDYDEISAIENNIKLERYKKSLVLKSWSKESIQVFLKVIR